MIYALCSYHRLTYTHFMMERVGYRFILFKDILEYIKRFEMTEISIVKELLEEDYLRIDSLLGKHRFKLNSKLSGYLIPYQF